MKKLGLLVALAMITGSASATIIMTDAELSTAASFFDTGNGSFVATDTAGDPGYNFTSTAQATYDVGGGNYAAFMYLGVDIVDRPTDVWHFEVENTSAFAAQVTLQVVIDGATVGTTINSGGLMAPGATYTFDWDLTVFGTTVEQLQWSTAAMGAQNSQITDISTTVIPEPATFGLVAAFGGALLFIRRKFR